jgi:predicted Zn-dependent peptidase
MMIELSQPRSRASLAFAAELFEPGTRYASPDGGLVDAVDALSVDDVRAFHTARFAAGSSTFIVVGDLSGVQPEALAARLFDGWDVPTPAAAEPAVVERARGRRVVIVDRPGSVQSMVQIGHPGPRRLVPDYVPLTTMAFALGGLFNSRLMTKLREEKGYTYGAYAGFDMRRHGGVFVSRAAVQTEVTAPAVADALAEISRMHDDGVTTSELDHVRKFRTQVFPVSFATPAAVAEGLSTVVVHGLPDDYFDSVREAIATVTPEQVDAAARDRLVPEDLVTVVVGDAAQIADALADVDAGPVTVVADEA